MALLKTYSIASDITSQDLTEALLHRELVDAGDIVSFTGLNRAGDVLEVHGTSYTESNVDATVLAHVKATFVHQEVSYAEMYFQGNSTDSVIAEANTPVKVAGTTTCDEKTDDFTHTSNKLTFKGEASKKFHVIATVSSTLGTGSGTKLVNFAIAKNDSVVAKTIAEDNESDTETTETALEGIIDLDNGDYVELYAENETDAEDILVVDLMFIIKQI